MKFDFGGWATRNDLRCSDGRTIRKNAFKAQDGQTVPLVWNHNHSDPNNILGLAHLENRDDGVYAYCEFNDNESGRTAKELVKHGDVRSLSIMANRLKETGKEVVHGIICEVSLVLAGANPGAFIDNIAIHGDEIGEAMVLGYDENITLYHSDKEDDKKDMKEKEKKETEKKESEKKESESGKTIKDVIDTMTEEQKTALYAIVGSVLDDSKDEEDDSEDDEDDEDDEKNQNGGKTMKHNVFDSDQREDEVLTHADQTNILTLAKSTSCGSLQDAIEIYTEQTGGQLAHGFEDIGSLFPDFKDVRPGAPELITRDQGWVSKVIQKVHKSPISRIRTRQADITGSTNRAHGYKKDSEKKVSGNVKLLKRTTDPQTIFVKDKLSRDDIVDITDFDVVEYQYNIMKQNLNEEVATAVMIGDGRDDGDEYKISQEHVRSIWNDDDLYCIHTDIDIAAAKNALQGANTNINFGENYIYAEAIIQSALYAREKYKGTGTPDFYCTPHLLNVMLLARDLNGRRIYDSITDLARALNVANIETAEQFTDKVRKTSDNKKKKLLGIFVNLADYQIGSTKGGEITRFNQFDIDFNQEKYLIETRISGALTRVYSAIALEEDVTNVSG